jgi:uncharacterized protein YqjF (DUF2071 family)
MLAVPQVSTARPIDRISPNVRPAGRPIGYHRWTNLLFVHWRVPAAVVRPLLPTDLTLDTWEDDAWVGLVPFRMSRVRPWWSPPVPGISYFCETNVRTYVHFRGRDPGVWFFSLEASNALAVRLARWRWHLPYFRARMSVERTNDSVEYKSRRLWPGLPGPGCTIRAEIGRPLRHGAGGPPSSGGRLPPAGRALPGSLEHFLIERYILYAQSDRGRLLSARVHHSPYPIREARLEELDDSLLAAAGLETTSAPRHTAFSDGVDVEIFPLLPVAMM